MNEFPVTPRLADEHGHTDNLASAHAGSGEAPTQAAGQTGQRPIPDDAMIVVPMRKLVLFPGLVVPIGLNRESSVAAAQEAARHELSVAIVLQTDPDKDLPGPDDLHSMATSAQILRYLTTPDGGHHMVCRGDQRVKLLEFLPGWPFLVARVEVVPAASAEGIEIEARFIQLKERVAKILELLPQAPAELAASAQAIDAPGALADFVAGLMDLEPGQKQALLSATDLTSRLDRILELVAHRIEVLKISNQIGQQTGERMNERQREMVLREQLRTIQKELGEDDGSSAEIDELTQRIETLGMPEAVLTQTRKEIKRLRQMPEAAGEYSMLRNYLDWLVELPWRADELAAIDIAAARRILDEDHFGLDKVKRRILEFLAVRKLNPHGRSPILCLVGPPGVGKTSLGQSIAKASGRKFARVSLGGVHDEAEIRGHRRTYIGALPGNIVQSLKKTGSRSCLMMLDEVDKLGRGLHGDPSAAMLEVLDPEQNNSFRDNYLGVPFDLSDVMFIATANALDEIAGPLRDRMEVIQLPGYTQQEKLEIARRYLIPRQLTANGLTDEQVTVADAAIELIIADYTREAGVRNLEREIGSVLRRIAVKVASAEAGQPLTPHQVDVDFVREVLGASRFENEVAMRTSLPGVATGLAWTPVGGDILFIEASRSPGSGKLTLTGQLGDVMKESAQAALTLLRTRASTLGIDHDIVQSGDIHVHIPAGAIPKDGPSAGVAMFLALTSMALERPIRSDVAMTGEISLRGLVLPVGGIKEKVLAALRAGIRQVLLPRRNARDLDELPPEARERLSFVLLDTVDDAIAHALTP